MKVLCISIDSDCIRFGQLDFSYKKKTIKHLSTLPISDTSQGDLGLLIAEYIETNNLYSERYAGIFSSKSCFIRHLNFPFHSKDKIRQVIKEEMEIELPFSMEDMEVDFSFGGKTKDNQFGVIGFAYKKEDIEWLLSTLKEAKIEPDYIIPDIAALEGVAGLYGDDGLIFVDIKDDHVNYYQKCTNGEKFLRSIHASSNNKSLITSLMSAGFKAENIYGECSCQLAVVDNVISQVQTKDSISEIYDCEVLDFTDYISQFCSFAIEADAVLSYSDIIGALVLIEKRGEIVNFRKGVYKKHSKFENIKYPLMRSLVLINLIMLSFLFYSYNKNFVLQKQLDMSKSNIETILKRNVKVLPKNLSPIQYKSLLLGKIKQLNSAGSGKYKLPEHTFIEIFNTVNKSLPKSIDIKVDRVAYDASSVMISGKAASYDTVDKAKALLAKNSIFQSVEIKRAKTNPKKGVVFDLLITLKEVQNAK
jgi:hypothetical protein